MKKEIQNNKIFLSLEHLIKFEWLGRNLNFLASKQKSNSVLSGKYTSKLRGRGLDFEEARPYVIGDDIRNIDWKVTAKTAKTHTKVFTEEKEKPALIFVDQSPTMGFGSTNKTKSVVAGELAALFSFKIFKGGDRIGALIYSGNEYELIAPKRNRQNITQILRSIIKSNLNIYDQKDKIDYAKSLKTIMSKLHHVITHDFFVILISDFNRYDPDVLKYICELSNHNDLLLIKVFDPMEQEIPPLKMSISDGINQINLNGKSNKVKEDIYKDFENNFLAFKNELDKYNIPIIKINTIDSIENQLKEVFQGVKIGL